MKKIVNGFNTCGGKHCITTALKQVFQYHNCKLSEEMIFGLGSGLSFVYINLDKSPMISGRTKPIEFEKKLGEKLNIEIKCRSSNKYEAAFNKTLKLLDNDKPVLVYTDMAYLDYLNLDADNHFGGHTVVIFGYDNEDKKFYVSDRDNSNHPIRTPKCYISENYHLVDYNNIENARSSKYRPFPANNKYLEINFDGYKEIVPEVIFSSIKETCDNMVNAPAKLLGLNGIYKFSKEILKWKNFDDEKLKVAGITNYFQINADGGTGGGIFRRMYGEFLMQSGKIVNSEKMRELGLEYIEVSESWDEVGKLMWRLAENKDRQLLKDMSDILVKIYNKETSILTELQELVLNTSN